MVASVKATLALVVALFLLVVLAALASLGAYMQPVKWSERKAWNQ